MPILAPCDKYIFSKSESSIFRSFALRYAPCSLVLPCTLTQPHAGCPKHNPPLCWLKPLVPGCGQHMVCFPKHFLIHEPWVLRTTERLMMGGAVEDALATVWLWPGLWTSLGDLLIWKGDNISALLPHKAVWNRWTYASMKEPRGIISLWDTIIR